MSLEDILLLIGIYSHALVIEKSVTFLFHNNFGGVIEEDSRCIVAQLVAEAVLATVVDEFGYVH